ncbi:hypothetical protein AAHE18_12G203200 [Arachis hypogaea]
MADREVGVDNPKNLQPQTFSARSVWLSIKSKNKLGFIDGSILKPEKTNSTYEAWDRCNTFVLSWLHSSLSTEILHSVLWCNVASELWNDLKYRFYEGDLFRIADLQEEMFAMKQGDLSITAYFTKLKGIWEELDEFKLILSCACGASCSLKSQIMLMVPLPSVNSIYSLLLQQERQLSNSDQSEERILVNVVNIGRTGGRGRVSSGRGMMRSCSYCGKVGHTIETCYHKYGFPPHLQKKFGVANAAFVFKDRTEHDTETETIGRRH